jgi:hypothetical protein
MWSFSGLRSYSAAFRSQIESGRLGCGQAGATLDTRAPRPLWKRREPLRSLGGPPLRQPPVHSRQRARIPRGNGGIEGDFLGHREVESISYATSERLKLEASRHRSDGAPAAHATGPTPSPGQTGPYALHRGSSPLPPGTQEQTGRGNDGANPKETVSERSLLHYEVIVYLKNQRTM